MTNQTSRISRLVAASVVAAVLAGCASTPEQRSRPVSTSVATASRAPVILAGDVAIVRLGQAITARFGDLDMSSQRTPDAYGDHARGLALDVLVPQWNTSAGVAQGDAITAWVQSHAAQYRVRYTLWNQHYQAAGDDPVPMEDRGQPTANNRDHVHITIGAPGASQ